MDTLRSLAELALALSAIIAFFALVWRLRPTKWLVKNLLHDPFQNWLGATVRAQVDEAVAELRLELSPNGGSSLKDKVDRIAAWIDAQS
jgi:hypothetical protein